MVHAYCAAFRTYMHALRLPWNRYQRENLVRFAGAFLTCRSLPVRRLARALSGPGRAHRAQDKRLRRFLGNEHLDMEAALASQLRFLLSRLGVVPFVR